MPDRLFAEQSVSVEAATRPDGHSDTVLLVADGSVVGSCSLEAFQNGVLPINSDLFNTGARDLVGIDPFPCSPTATSTSPGTCEPPWSLDST